MEELKSMGVNSAFCYLCFFSSATSVSIRDSNFLFNKDKSFLLCTSEEIS